MAEWTIHNERVVDDSRRAHWSIAEVELPDGTEFEQYVYRAPAAAMMLMVVDGAALMIRRHRFVIDRWVWELPGGYREDGESMMDCAIREAEEETGWRPSKVRPLIEFQPWVATADAVNSLYIAEHAEIVREHSDVNEASEMKWIPFERVPELIRNGEVIGSASIIGLQAAMLDFRQ
ncbi:NUDIX hydrolase [Haloglycomyces albus]|uniref:NUDIX hydrolase n=1 Tax=Haloglycomyces albus TaxID=526067 RepID=UPI00046CB656|nr:NUDIX hydrolase [Haloglycomyces albus]